MKLSQKLNNIWVNKMQAVTNKTLEKLKYDLVREGLVEFDVVNQATQLAQSQNTNIGQVLINSGVITEDAILKFLEEKLHIPFVNLNDYSLDKNTLKYISYNDAKKYKILPLFKIENVLTVAMADPMDLFAIDKIVETAECSIEAVIASEKVVLEKIDEYYNEASGTDKIMTTFANVDYDWREELHNDDLSDAHIHKIISSILRQAVIENVHEIVFRLENEGFEVTFKTLNEVLNKGTIPTVLMESFIAKLKNLAQLDSTVSEVPQLGKIDFSMGDLTLVASVSTFPTIMGERIYIKLYKPPTSLRSLVNTAQNYNLLINAAKEPGVIFICGSQLSGKTHLIYSLLNEISSPDKNIMTIESIAKYNLANVNQCELNENVGFNMDKASKFIEFQSPDIIYLEGIKNKETFDYFSELVFNDKVIVMEFLANNMEDLRNKMAYSDFETLKSLISCLVFIHSQNSIEVFDRETAQKYLA